MPLQASEMRILQDYPPQDVERLRIHHSSAMFDLPVLNCNSIELACMADEIYNSHTPSL